MMDPEVWVSIAFVIFLTGLGYLGVYKMMLNALDQRSDRIKAELDEARRLKEEAQSLLAEYRRKQRATEQEAAEIISQARAEADRMAAEAKTKMDDFVVRRTRMADAKIAQAEAQALAEVRAAAADAAVAAAAAILTETVKGEFAEQLIAKGVADVKTKLN
jgi:F-type H+-transporting ATPase subunit b